MAALSTQPTAHALVSDERSPTSEPSKYLARNEHFNRLVDRGNSPTIPQVAFSFLSKDGTYLSRSEPRPSNAVPFLPEPHHSRKPFRLTPNLGSTVPPLRVRHHSPFHRLSGTSDGRCRSAVPQRCQTSNTSENNINHSSAPWNETRSLRDCTVRRSAPSRFEDTTEISPVSDFFPLSCTAARNAPPGHSFSTEERLVQSTYKQASEETASNREQLLYLPKIRREFPSDNYLRDRETGDFEHFPCTLPTQLWLSPIERTDGGFQPGLDDNQRYSPGIGLTNNTALSKTSDSDHSSMLSCATTPRETLSRSNEEATAILSGISACNHSLAVQECLVTPAPDAKRIGAPQLLDHRPRRLGMMNFVTELLREESNHMILDATSADASTEQKCAARSVRDATHIALRASAGGRIEGLRKSEPLRVRANKSFRSFQGNCGSAAGDEENVISPQCSSTQSDFSQQPLNTSSVPLGRLASGPSGECSRSANIFDNSGRLDFVGVTTPNVKSNFNSAPIKSTDRCRYTAQGAVNHDLSDYSLVSKIPSRASHQNPQGHKPLDAVYTQTVSPSRTTAACYKYSSYGTPLRSSGALETLRFSVEGPHKIRFTAPSRCYNVVDCERLEDAHHHRQLRDRQEQKELDAPTKKASRDAMATRIVERETRVAAARHAAKCNYPHISDAVSNSEADEGCFSLENGCQCPSGVSLGWRRRRWFRWIIRLVVVLFVLSTSAALVGFVLFMKGYLNS